MKTRILIVLVLIAGAAFAGRLMSGSGGESLGAGRDERRESFRLDPGARVEVRGINGPVEIVATDADRAELYILRTASNGQALESRKIIVEHAPSSLIVYGEGGASSLPSRLFGKWGGEYRERVELRVPLRSQVSASDVNGHVKIGEMNGPVEISDINGRVEVAGFAGSFKLTGVNGSVAVSSAGDGGMEITGVNGSVEVRLSGDADINVLGNNGRVSLNLPNVTVTKQESEHPAQMSARIGAGGPQINITGVNGNISFEPAAASAEAPSGSSSKTTPTVLVPMTFPPPPPPPASKP